MTAELEVAYLGVQVADPAAFARFLTDVVGLVPGETTAGGAATAAPSRKVPISVPDIFCTIMRIGAAFRRTIPATACQ